MRNVDILVSSGIGVKVENANDGVRPESLDDGNVGRLRLKPNPLPLLPPLLSPPESPLTPSRATTRATTNHAAIFSRNARHPIIATFFCTSVHPLLFKIQSQAPHISSK